MNFISDYKKTQPRGAAAGRGSGGSDCDPPTNRTAPSSWDWGLKQVPCPGSSNTTKQRRTGALSWICGGLKHKTQLYTSLTTLRSSLVSWNQEGGGMLPWHAVRAQTCYYLKGCTKVKSLIPLIQTTNKQNPKNGIPGRSWALPGLVRGLSIHIAAASYEPPAKKLLQRK